MRKSTSIQYQVCVRLSHHFAVLTVEPNGHSSLELTCTISPNVSDRRVKGQMRIQWDGMIPQHCQQRQRWRQMHSLRVLMSLRDKRYHSHMYPPKLRISHLHLL